MWNRRTMLGRAAAGAALIAAGGLPALAADLPLPTAAKLPRWRGFNLLEMFLADNSPAPFRESDFALIAELGFDFARLPLDYRCWTDRADWTKFREDRLTWIDRAVEYGRRHGVHVQINFHRAPGYTVADPPEAKSVWTDPEARDVCALHWGRFADRYRGISPRALSFNLFNEPAKVEPGPHREAVARMVEEIRRRDPARPILCDGRDWGTKPPTELVGLGVAAATRGYAPFHLTHWKANWVKGSDAWPKPSYPLHEGSTTWDRSNLQRDQIAPWKALEAAGMGVMVGEFGAFKETPHPAVIPWMRDCLDAWKAAGWGWALWNFRGGFGILDSDRSDVAYDDWRGHKLDRAMLDLLRSS